MAETLLLVAMTTSVSDSLGPRKETAVDSIHHGSGTDLSAAKEAPVETFDGVFPSLDPIELEIDLALGVGIQGNVDDVSVLLLTLGSDVVLQLLDPGLALLPGEPLAGMPKRMGEGHILGWVEHVLEHDASAGHADVRRSRFRLRIRPRHLKLLVGAVGLRDRLVGSSELPHECVPAVVIEVDAGNVSVVQGASSSCTFVGIPPSGAVEGASCATGVCTASAETREGRALKAALIVAVAMEAL